VSLQARNQQDQKKQQQWQSQLQLQQQQFWHTFQECHYTILSVGVNMVSQQKAMMLLNTNVVGHFAPSLLRETTVLDHRQIDSYNDAIFTVANFVQRFKTSFADVGCLINAVYKANLFYTVTRASLEKAWFVED